MEAGDTTKGLARARSSSGTGSSPGWCTCGPCVRGEPCQRWQSHRPQLVIAVRHRADPPKEVLDALARQAPRQKFSAFVEVLHFVDLGYGRWVGVVGDPNNGVYEHFVMRDGKLTCSDAGYGCSAQALLDILKQEVAG